MKGGWPRGRGSRGVEGLGEEAAGTPRQGWDPISVIPQARIKEVIVRTPSRATRGKGSPP